MKKINTLFALALMASMPLMAQTWGTAGNTVATGEYIGSKNAANLEIKTAGTSRIIIGPTGNINFPGFTGSGTRLVQTSPAGLLSPFALSTAANVLCGDGIWRPLNTISSAQWISSGTHLYSGNTGSVGIGVNPTSLTDLSKLNIVGDLDNTSLYSFSNHSVDLKINSIIKVNRENAIALAIENTTPLVLPWAPSVTQRIPFAIFGDGRVQISTGLLGPGKRVIFSVRPRMAEPIANADVFNGKGDDGNGFAIYTDGTVGIESAFSVAPSAKGFRLAVGGKIICEELVVKLAANWPDYVFGDTYKLKDLKELETYIAVNKHLPNIPSAQEVADKGFETGDIIKRQMEKIEELSLYLIQQNKLIAAQQQQLDVQNKKATEQEKRLALLEAKMK
jgi:hypothetical protein